MNWATPRLVRSDTTTSAIIQIYNCSFFPFACFVTSSKPSMLTFFVLLLFPVFMVQQWLLLWWSPGSKKFMYKRSLPNHVTFRPFFSSFNLYAVYPVSDFLFSFKLCFSYFSIAFLSTQKGWKEGGGGRERENRYFPSTAFHLSLAGNLRQTHCGTFSLTLGKLKNRLMTDHQILHFSFILTVTVFEFMMTVSISGLSFNLFPGSLMQI